MIPDANAGILSLIDANPAGAVQITSEIDPDALALPFADPDGALR